jgi:hypothetical protein
MRELASKGVLQCFWKKQVVSGFTPSTILRKVIQTRDLQLVREWENTRSSLEISRLKYLVKRWIELAWQLETLRI